MKKVYLRVDREKVGTPFYLIFMEDKNEYAYYTLPSVCNGKRTPI